MVMMICLSVQGMAVVHAQQSKRELSFSIDSIPKIEIAVELIKKFEGIHRDSTCFPYYPKQNVIQSFIMNLFLTI